MYEHEPTFKEDEAQLENEEDISSLDYESFADAVVSSNDWTTETVINQINKGNIKLNPDFQRREAWDKKRKSRFVESLILGLPIPQIVLAASKERKGSYIVLDGKQRLLSVRQFAAHDGDKLYDQLKLTSLEIRKDLNGETLDSFKSNLTLFDDVAAFENQPIRTVVIKNWPSEAFLYQVFLRLNTGSVPLSPQELRQALHPGKFVTFLDRESSTSSALREILNIKKPDFRMRDAELLLRYFAFRNFLSQYSGTLKAFLDDCCNQLNKDWSIEEDTLVLQLQELEESHKTVKRIFENNAYRKWNGRSYESRFNRAIFDIMIHSFIHKEVREKSEGKEELIETSFQELCEHDKDFKNSIESTTKSLTATQTRFYSWNKVLNSVLTASLPEPQLIENRIV